MNKNINYPLKIHSHSMPIIAPSPKISAKVRPLIKNQIKNLFVEISPSNHQKLIQFDQISNKQEEQLNNKMKIIAERSLKKLQQRYKTIDRWKQRYISNNSRRYQKNLDQLQDQDKSQSDNQQQIATKDKSIKKSILLPLLKKKCIDPCFPDHGDKVKKIEAELLARLEKNKKYYQMKSNYIEKQINYFDQSNQIIPPQKKREIELKKLFMRAQIDKEKNQTNTNGLFYQKMNLIAQNLVQQTFLPQKIKQKPKECSKQAKTLNQQQSPYHRQPREPIQRSQSIHELKIKLMQQVALTTPEGWQSAKEMALYSEQYQLLD